MKDTLTIVKKKAKCQFCNNFCIRGDKNIENNRWWKCEECRINYLISFDGKIDTANFRSSNISNEFYTIRILFKEEESTIHFWTKKDTYYSATSVVTLNSIINITPENMQDKLKTYLLFL